MILLWLKALLHKPTVDADMDEEMRSHIEMQRQENIEAGMNPKEARHAAMRQFGSTESIKQECREQQGVAWFENFIQDLRFGSPVLKCYFSPSHCLILASISLICAVESVPRCRRHFTEGTANMPWTLNTPVSRK
jgi:hypothetical protein